MSAVLTTEKEQAEVIVEAMRIYGHLPSDHIVNQLITVASDLLAAPHLAVAS